jgi:hypothetical protein
MSAQLRRELHGIQIECLSCSRVFTGPSVLAKHRTTEGKCMNEAALRGNGIIANTWGIYSQKSGRR